MAAVLFMVSRKGAPHGPLPREAPPSPIFANDASRKTADPGLFPASSHASLSLDASLFHGFSNRSINRFTDFEIGPTFTLNF